MTREMTKVVLNGPNPDETETLWASPIGSNQYKLDNSPFFAYGVSWQDIVEAHGSGDSFPEFLAVVQKSGNRTVRIVFDTNVYSPESEKVMAQLRDLGCTYEGMPPRLISVNVPPETELDVVAEYLTSSPGLQWEYADPTYEEVTGEVDDSSEE